MESILLVEDDLEWARALKEKLSEKDTYQVRHARSAEEALEEIQSHPQDLLIVDWMLPEMNGPRLIEGLREAGNDTPILMLTVRRGTKDLVRGLENGADDYMTKPADFDELEARVKALLRRPPRWKPIDELTVGPLKVKPARREALLGGKLLDLRRKEFDLLLLLADREPHVVTRETLAERVWGTEHASDNSIDVTISALRKKMHDVLGKTSGALQLETTRGVGYRLLAEDRAATS